MYPVLPSSRQLLLFPGDHPVGVVHEGTFTAMGRLAGVLPSRTPPSSRATIATAQLPRTCRVSYETESCLFEHCLYQQRADAIRSAVPFLQQNRSLVRTSSTYRSASASVVSLNRPYSTVGPPASASVRSPNRANSTVGLPASSGSSARAVLPSSAVPATRAISVSVSSARTASPPAGAKDGRWIQGAGSLVNAATTPTARGPCVRRGVD